MSRPARVYLPAVGPAPLRMQKAATSAPPASLPPLAMTDPPPRPAAELTSTNLSANLPAPPTGEPAPAVAPVPAPTAPAPIERTPMPGNGGSPLLVEGGADDRGSGPIVTPGMLVQYFKPVGSNLVAGTLGVPVFLPPTTPASSPVKSSSATYRSQ